MVSLPLLSDVEAHVVAQVIAGIKGEQPAAGHRLGPLQAPAIAGIRFRLIPAYGVLTCASNPKSEISL